MGRRSAEEMQQIEQLIRKIKVEENVDSPTKINEILESKYSVHVSNKTLLALCKKTIVASDETDESDIELAYENNSEIKKVNERIAQLENDFKEAVSVSDRCRISSQLDSAQKSKLEMKKILREAEMLKQKTEQATIVIQMERPTVVELEKKEKKEDVVD